MTIDINQIPYQALRRFHANKAVLLTRADDEGKVLISTSLDPEDLHETTELDALRACREQECVYSITMTILRLDHHVIGEATSFLENRYRIISELDTLLRYEGNVYVVYVITHYNPQQKPLGPLTVNIGGDCYRTGRAIKDLESILHRTRDLAEAMLKKAVMIFPDIPALHGGKKGEWIILDQEGKKIEGLSEEAIIALGSAIIPKGIKFLNRYKELQARKLGICDAFPARGYVRPDSGSPDVLSGVYWRGERPNKYINMCDAWSKRGADMSQYTCLPPKLGGTRDSSARPTGYGVATTTHELARRYFGPRGRQPAELRFLLEAAGGVGQNTVEALIEKHGIPAENITVFDRSEEACTLVHEKFGVNIITLRHTDFYEHRLVRDLRRDIRYDVWVNNGEGDNTKPAHVANLIRAGVKVFAGGANNFLKVANQAESRDLIFKAGCWAWPDPATSGGGWTLAVLDIMTRCQGKKADSDKTRRRILDIITTRNSKLVADVLDGLPDDAAGDVIWRKVDDLIQARVKQTLALSLSPEEILERADSRHWQLT
jgi:Glutamate/Leucine/Phenylalanine/Valine dehydrogenase